MHCLCPYKCLVSCTIVESGHFLRIGPACIWESDKWPVGQMGFVLSLCGRAGMYITSLHSLVSHRCQESQRTCRKTRNMGIESDSRPRFLSKLPGECNLQQGSWQLTPNSFCGRSGRCPRVRHDRSVSWEAPLAP